jgi:tetratricopeptide (TPR) repeat protein
MIELDPRDWRLYQHERRFPVFVVISAIIILLAGGVSYWCYAQKQKYDEVYHDLGIAPLPITLALSERYRTSVDQLSREPCYGEAIIAFSDALLEAGYPRQSAMSVLSFTKRCGRISDEILLQAYYGFMRVNDFPAALRVIDELVKNDLASATYRYTRADTYERMGDYSHALGDYINAIQLFGPTKAAADNFYDVSRMYAALHRYCDAITPIETFIAFHPSKRQDTQITRVIAEYAQQGSCDTRYASGFDRIPFLGLTNTRNITVIVNGVTGNFILDTGASLMSVTANFAAKSKIKIESGNQLTLGVVGGQVLADFGYATTVSVGKAQAQGVAIAVIKDSKDPFDGMDGLLGMSFLARFNVTLSQNGVELTAIPLR